MEIVHMIIRYPLTILTDKLSLNNNLVSLYSPESILIYLRFVRPLWSEKSYSGTLNLHFLCPWEMW